MPRMGQNKKYVNTAFTWYVLKELFKKIFMFVYKAILLFKKSNIQLDIPTEQTII